MSSKSLLNRRGFCLVGTLLGLQGHCDFATAVSYPEGSASLRHGMAIVQGAVESISANFLLDTGCPLNVISEEMSLQLGVSRSKQDLIDTSSEQLNFTVGTLQNNSRKATWVIDLNPLSQIVGIKLDGILGCSFLEDKSIHFRKDAVVVAASDATPGRGEAATQCVADEHGQLYVSPRTILLDLPLIGPSLVDSGMNASLGLTQQTFDMLLNHGTIELRRETEVLEYTAKGRNERNRTRNGVINLEGASDRTSRPLRVIVTDVNSIGLPLLMDSATRFDFPSQRMFIRPLIFRNAP